MEEQFDILSYLRQHKSRFEGHKEQEDCKRQAEDKDPLTQGKKLPGKEAGRDKSGTDPFWSQASAVASLEEWKKVCLTCRRCSLREGANGVVFGEGDPRARLIFIGEGPGEDEDRLGRPFVGKAGRLLNRILEAAGLEREEVFIANIVKCRPPRNRAPQREEIETCLPLLEKQIELIDPPLLVCLGAVAAKALLRPDFSITRERGGWNEFRGRLLMPTFHPAALLYDPSKKKPVWEDILQVMDRYRKIGPKER